MRNIFTKKKYLDCPNLKHSLHFFYDEIRACCSNVPGPVFYPDYNGETVDFYYIYEQRQKYYKEINSFFSEVSAPKECLKCFDAKLNYSDKKIDKFPNEIHRIYFQNHMSCNAKCTYCTFAHVEKGYKYKVLPIVKSLIDKKLLIQNASIYMSGGETTISPEFEELLSLLTSYITNNKIEILTSGIKYCESIKNGFMKDKLKLIISLDSGTKETYKKIKCVDCFDKIVENLKVYTDSSDNAKENITLKYIIVDKENDNKEEIEKFFDVVVSLGIRNVRLDIDYEKYKFTRYIKVPEYYFDLIEHFNSIASKNNLNVQICEQVLAVLNKGHM